MSLDDEHTSKSAAAIETTNNKDDPESTLPVVVMDHPKTKQK